MSEYGLQNDLLEQFDRFSEAILDYYPSREDRELMYGDILSEFIRDEKTYDAFRPAYVDPLTEKLRELGDNEKLPILSTFCAEDVYEEHFPGDKRVCSQVCSYLHDAGLLDKANNGEQKRFRELPLEEQILKNWEKSAELYFLHQFDKFVDESSSSFEEIAAAVENQDYKTQTDDVRYLESSVNSKGRLQFNTIGEGREQELLEAYICSRYINEFGLEEDEITLEKVVAHPDYPNKSQFYTSIRSFSDAIVAAGFNPKSGTGFWTPERIEHRLRWINDQQGKIPKTAELWSLDIFPQKNTFYKHYDSIDHALIEAGFNPSHRPIKEINSSIPKPV